MKFEREFNAYVSLNNPYINVLKDILFTGCFTLNNTYTKSLAPSLMALALIQNVKMGKLIEVINILQKIEFLEEKYVKSEITRLELGKLAMTGEMLNRELLSIMRGT